MNIIIYLGYAVLAFGIMSISLALWALHSHREKKYNAILHEHNEQKNNVMRKIEQHRKQK